MSYAWTSGGSADISSGGSSSNVSGNSNAANSGSDDSGGGSSYGSVTRDRGSAGATDDGGGPTVGVGDDPSDIDVGPNPRSPVDDSDDSSSSSSDVGSITRDRGSAGVTDDGGGPTLGLDDIGGDFTITGTTNQTPDEPPIAPDLVGDGSLEEALDDLNITLPGSNAGSSGSGLSLWLIGGIVAVLGVVLLGGNYGDS